MLISLQDIGVSFAGTTILEHITADVQEDSRIGLIGPNGAGKSTLLNMITGELENEWGEIYRKPMLGVGYLHQNSGLTGGNTIRREMRSVFQKVLDAKEQLDDLQLDMGQLDPQSAEYKEKAAAYDKLLSYYEVNDGYTIDVKIQSVLNGMGFRGRDLDTRISTLSGGEKTRLALCKLLLAEPELLILDEPTNHLDFKTLRWLEEHLKEYKGAVIVVSHDRYFLDETAKEIWEVEFQSMRVFPGNYSKYKVLKADLMARWEKEYEAQQEEIADLEGLRRPQPRPGHHLQVRQIPGQKAGADGADRAPPGVQQGDVSPVHLRPRPGQGSAECPGAVADRRRGGAEKSTFLTTSPSSLSGGIRWRSSGKTGSANPPSSKGSWGS